MRLNTPFSLGSRVSDKRSDRIRHRIAAGVAVLVSALMVVVSIPTTATAATFSDDGAPRPSATSAVINVKVGGIRSADGAQNLTALAGVKLGLYSGSTTVMVCTSDVGGYCSFTVSGTNLNNSYTIKQLAPASGTDAAENYYSNPSLTTGLNSSDFQRTTYTVTTPTIVANKTYTSGTNGFMVDSGANRTASSGIWQNSYINPQIPSRCGLSVAILMDLSSSVAKGNYLGDLKKAAKAIVDALSGTPSNIALYSFGTRATAVTSSLAVSSSANVETLKEDIEALSIPGTQYTNWDAGLFQMAGKGYDQVLVITDGNPTAYTTAGIHSVRGDTRFLETEQAIASANVLKSEGTRVVAVGVGTGVSGPGDNLMAISGPNKDSDYYQKATYTEATSALKTVALAGCTGTVTVVKNVVPYTSPAGSITDATPTSGWTFTHSTDATGSAVPTPSTGRTDATGSVNYAVAFAPGRSTANLTITETQLTGYTIVPQATFNAVCRNNDSGANVPVVNAADGSPGFTVVASKSDTITCSVYNRAPSPGASLVVDKKWVVNGGVPMDNHSQPSGLSGQLTLDGSDWAWGAVTSRHTVGNAVAIDERLTDTNELCRIVDSRITAPGDHELPVTATLATGSNSYTITNYVTCDAQLTLLKTVVNNDGGTATAAAWDLTATPASGTALSVKSGTTTVVPAGVNFVLDESAGPAGYSRTSMQCSIGSAPFTDATSIAVPAEEHATCVLTNDDIAPQLKLTKIVSPSGAAPAAKWSLRGTGSGSPTVTGNGGTGFVAVKAGVPYTLSESPVAGFTGAAEFSSGAWICTVAGGDPVALVGGALPALLLGERIECAVTNTLDAIVPRIVKTAGTPVANADGTWTISYDIAVTNPSAVAAISYDLTDTPAFGGDISYVALSATGPNGTISGWTGEAPSTALATGTSLAANTTHHYTVMVKATVEDGAFDAVPDTTQCAPGVDPAAGGFLNRAVLTSAGIDYPADDCVEPVKPTFAKSAGSASSNADGTWNVTYTLTATNPSKTTALTYDLADTLALPAGVSVTGVVITSPSKGSPSTPVVVNPLWNGGPESTLVTGQPLAADTTDAYTITLTLSVPPTVPASSLVCDGHTPNKGLFNAALLESGNQSISSDACATLTLPTVTHTKTVSSTKQESDGTWTITYDVVVTNRSSTLDGIYNLVDVPALGSGITRSSAGSATGPAVATSSWNGDSNTTLALSQPIAPSGIHTYVVTVHAAVAAGVIGTDAANCTIDGAENGTGFLNVATLTVGGGSTDREDCSQPVSPSFTKVLDGALVPGFDEDDYTVNYTLTATNSTTVDLYYDLDDTLGFAGGVIIRAATATGPDGPVVGWNGSGSTVIATARALPAGVTDVYTVSVDLTVTERVSKTDQLCSQTGTPGQGLFNGAVLTSGADIFPDSACAPIPPQLPTLSFDPPTLAFTGAEVSGGVIAGLALLGFGLLLIPFRRRREPKHLA